MSFVLWILVTIATILPMLRLLPHFGIRREWAYACIIPFGALALLWWMKARLQELEKR